MKVDMEVTRRPCHSLCDGPQAGIPTCAAAAFTVLGQALVNEGGISWKRLAELSL